MNWQTFTQTWHLFAVYRVSDESQLNSHGPGRFDKCVQVNGQITEVQHAIKQAIVTLVERKSGFAVLAEVLHKSADLVGRAIEEKLKPFGSHVKT